MARKRLIWQIFPTFMLVILIALVAISWLFAGTLNRFSREEARRGLEAQAALVVPQVESILNIENVTRLDRLSKTLGQQSGTRLTFILADGQVVGDSEESPQRMENHSGRPEVQVALSGKTGAATRYSRTLQQEMMYVAEPIFAGDQIIGCVRTALPVSGIAETLHSVFSQLINSAIIIAIIAALVSFWLAGRLSRPLEEMKLGAARFARGELDRRLPPYRGEELGGLSDAMNQMASQLNERIRSEVRQRNERDAILASMIEGVLAINNEEKILSFNQAASRLLAINPKLAVGQSIQEVIRKPVLQQFITEALASPTSIEADMTLLYQSEERALQAHGTPLCGADGKKFGVLIVIHDVTRLRRLENLRRDFVANVSHELKTPITAIKGAVETLLGGANSDPASSERFLEIASRQADRLNAIIEDLLALSRLERDAESVGIQRQQENLLPIFESAFQACASTAAAKEVRLKLFCSEQLVAKVNGALLEQALINLIDNAIKYSDAERLVTVEGWQEGSRLRIKVQDRGLGIPREHLPRLFERFYRVDAARSRAIGGTGLGLAIVKHIVQAHNGEVTVHSTPGEGSVFMISLPLA